VHAFIAGCRCSLDFNRVLEGRRFFLSVHEMDLQRQEEKLAEEQARVLSSFDGGDISAEVEELHGCVAGIQSERAIEVVQLSRSIMEIFDALIDLGTFSIRDIPAQPELAQDVLTAAILILECL
jgi:hypothetical protein